MTRTSFTWITWHYPTTQTAGRRIAGKANSPITTEAVYRWATADTNDITAQVGRATVGAVTITTGLNIPLNAWAFTVMTYDETNGINIYNGTLTVAAAIASYTTQTIGSGATVDVNGPMGYGNEGDTTFALAYEGRIAFFGMWNRVLTLGEIIQQQWKPHVTSGCVVFQYPGSNGTGTQPDWSGNNNSGVVTGATVGVGVSLGATF